MKIRDIVALPFLFLGLACESIAIFIGGEWTAVVIIKSYGIEDKTP